MRRSDLRVDLSRRIPLAVARRRLLRDLRIRGMGDRRRGDDIVSKSAERRRVACQKGGEGRGTRRIARMIRERRHASGHAVFLVLAKRPHHAPRIESGFGARVRAGAIGVALGSSVRLRRIDRSDEPLLIEVINIVVDVVIHFVTQHAGQLVAILRHRQQRRRNVDVSAGNGKRVGRTLVHQVEVKRREILRVRYRGDAVRNGLQRGVQRRLRRNDLALLHQFHVPLLPQARFPRSFLGRRIVGTDDDWEQKSGRRNDGQGPTREVPHGAHSSPQGERARANQKRKRLRNDESGRARPT